MKKSLFFNIVLVLVLLYLLICLSMNFTLLGIIAIICMLFFGWWYKSNNKPVYSWVPACLMMLGFTFVSIFTMRNYFYTDKVFKNNEHHALKIDGISIDNPTNYILVKNDSTALFDDELFHGSLTIDSYTDSKVTLKYNNFTHPIYKIYRFEDFPLKDELYQNSRHAAGDPIYVMLNEQDDIIGFGPGEVVTFVVDDNRKIDFWFEEFNEEKNIKLFKHPSDSAHYFFRVNGEEPQMSGFSTMLVQGYALNNLMEGVDVDTRYYDFTGINVVRQVADRRALNAEKCHVGGTQLALEITQEAFGDEINRIKEIRIGDKIYNLNGKSNRGTRYSGTIDVEYGRNGRIFIGYGEHQTRAFSFNRDTINNRLEIRFQESIYRGINAVDDRRENTLYVTNSMIRDTDKPNDDNGVIRNNIGINVPNNVLSFDFFSHTYNKNMFRPFYLSFSAGNTTERMVFIWDDGNDKIWQSGDSICDYNDNTISAKKKVEHIFIKSDDNVSWIFNTENLREKTNFDSMKMMLTVLIVGLVCSVMITLSVGKDSSNNTFNLIEFCAYIVVIYYVAVRCFLLWRITVFRPLENISQFELNFFMNRNNYLFLLVGLAIFFIVIFIVKMLMRRIDPKNNLFISIVDKIKNASWPLLLASLFMYVVCVGVAAINSRVGLACIVLCYFVIDFFINAKYNPVYINKEEDGYEAVTAFIFTFFNMMIASVLMIMDGGFMVMFLTFCLIALCPKILDLYTKTHDYTKINDNNKKVFVMYALYLLGVIFVLARFKTVIINRIESRWFILGMFVILTIFFMMLFKYVARVDIRKISKIDSKYMSVVVSLYIFLGLGLVLGTVTAIADYTVYDFFEKNSRSTIQRVRVQTSEPHEVLLTIETNADEVGFLQASHNHWIIEQYNRRANDVNPMSSKRDFLELQPQSKLGAMWNAQLTDIVLLRYVITEHGKWLPIIFIFLFLSMLYYGISTPTYFRFSKSLLIQIPLLIFMQALLVWLANTQRFIFFGQDFPFISITSKVMLVYIFVLMTIWVSIAIFESVKHKDNDESSSGLSTFYEHHAKVVTCLFGFVIFVYHIISSYQYKLNESKDSKYEQMGELFRTSQPYINVLDSLFTEYQVVMGVPELKNNMHYEIVDFDKKYASVIQSEFGRIDSLIDKNDSDDASKYHFIKRIWSNYVNSGSYNNSYDRIIRVHKPDTLLHISLRKDYYDMILPHKYNETWTGSIIEEHKSQIANDTIITTNHFTYYQLPTQWFKDGETYHFLKRTSDSDVEVFSLSSNRTVLLDRNGIRQVVALYDNDDHVQVDNERVEYLPLESANYWARNILVNGRHTLLYPSGEDLFWISHFARLVKLVEEEKSDELEKNVPITLDRKLTSSLYNRLKNSVVNNTSRNHRDYSIAQRSVIVVDGNGHVKTMVDYKNGYELNPNDYKKIGDLEEELYMNVAGDKSVKERNYFENRNFSPLRGGPGSSQKPLVWTAVASAIDYDWKNLALVGIPAGKIKTEDRGSIGKSHYIIEKFNGEKVARFRSLGSDERVISNASSLSRCSAYDIDLKHYLAYSSNYYSALMVYLGLHSADLYENDGFINTIGGTNDSTHAFRRITPSSMSDDKYCDNFPFMKVGRNKRLVSLGKTIEREIKTPDNTDYVYHLKNSVLYNQLIGSFGLDDTHMTGRVTTNLYSDYLTDSIVINDESRRGKAKDTIYPEVRMPAAMPAISSINFNKFEYTPENSVTGWGFQFTNNIVRDIAIGSASAWNVTPLTMAEMYGKMLTMNSNFTCTLNPYKKMDEADLIGINSDNFNDARAVMYKSMNIFFTEGTGKDIVRRNGVIKKSGENAWIEYDGKKYYIYGKTGTTNTSLHEYRRLAIVITDTKMDEVDAMPEKFYILYFTYDFIFGDMFGTSYEIIEDVVKSECFQNYMNN